MYQGGQTIEVEVSLYSIPMFLRSGAIVPLCECNKIKGLKL